MQNAYKSRPQKARFRFAAAWRARTLRRLSQVKYSDLPSLENPLTAEERTPALTAILEQAESATSTDQLSKLKQQLGHLQEEEAAQRGESSTYTYYDYSALPKMSFSEMAQDLKLSQEEILTPLRQDAAFSSRYQDLLTDALFSTPSSDWEMLCQAREIVVQAKKRSYPLLAHSACASAGKTPYPIAVTAAAPGATSQLMEWEALERLFQDQRKQVNDLLLLSDAAAARYREMSQSAQRLKANARSLTAHRDWAKKYCKVESLLSQRQSDLQLIAENKYKKWDARLPFRPQSDHSGSSGRPSPANASPGRIQRWDDDDTIPTRTCAWYSSRSGWLDVHTPSGLALFIQSLGMYLCLRLFSVYRDALTWYTGEFPSTIPERVLSMKAFFIEAFTSLTPSLFVPDQAFLLLATLFVTVLGAFLFSRFHSVDLPTLPLALPLSVASFFTVDVLVSQTLFPCSPAGYTHAFYFSMAVQALATILLHSALFGLLRWLTCSWIRSGITSPSVLLSIFGHALEDMAYLISYGIFWLMQFFFAYRISPSSPFFSLVILVGVVWLLSRWGEGALFPFALPFSDLGANENPCLYPDRCLSTLLAYGVSSLLSLPLAKLWPLFPTLFQVLNLPNLNLARLLQWLLTIVLTKLIFVWLTCKDAPASYSYFYTLLWRLASAAAASAVFYVFVPSSYGGSGFPFLPNQGLALTSGSFSATIPAPALTAFILLASEGLFRLFGSLAGEGCATAYGYPLSLLVWGGGSFCLAHIQSYLSSGTLASFPISPFRTLPVFLLPAALALFFLVCDARLLSRSTRLYDR